MKIDFRQLLLCAAICSYSLAGAAELKERSNVNIGFSDQHGTQLLRTHSSHSGNQASINPSEFKMAACSNRKIFSLHFIGAKQSDPKDSLRESSYNFNESGGDLYKVNEPFETREGENCFLFTDDFLKSRKMQLPEPARLEWLVPETIIQIEDQKNRAVKSIHILGQIKNAANLALVEFEPAGKSGLVSLAAITPSGIVFYDYPAEINEISTWRIDDGGEFNPEFYQIVFSYTGEKKFGIGINWIGAEGSSMFVLESNGERIEEVANGSLYQAPR